MYALNKSERLCSKILIEELLKSRLSFVKYPFRVVYNVSSKAGPFPARIAVSVSKKKFKRAVKRNRIKRLVREAFRLHKEELYSQIPSGYTLDILLIYLEHELWNFDKTERAVKAALEKLGMEWNMNLKKE